MEALMAQRRIGQLGWSDAFIAKRRSERRNRLQDISGLLDWGAFEKLVGGIYSSRRGEAAYPALMMFQVLLLQRWYDLSDPEMEDALSDRLSFRLFCGLSIEDETPDHSTIWRFRERLTRRGLMVRLLSELSRQLDGGGFILKQGTLIDASIVESAARRPRMREGKTSANDPDARFGTGNQRGGFSFGYKLHVAVDQGSGLVRAVAVTPANIQEVMLGPGLIQGDEAAVYADRGYDAARMRDRLDALGIGNGILRRGKKNKPITAEEKARNHALSLKRRPVEKLFGTLKRSYRMARMRYFNQARNATALCLACFAYNLRRLDRLATP
jgi:IS5 family transposase